MANDALTIGDLPPVDLPGNGGVVPGTALIEVQIGTGAGSSQQAPASKLPISDAQAAVNAAKANKDSPTFTGPATMDGPLSGYQANITQKTGASYTLAPADCGKVVELSHTAAITLTLPNNLPAGFCCTLVQTGAGQVTLASASGATLKHRQNHTRIAGTEGLASIYITANSNGSSAVYRWGGDTVA